MLSIISETVPPGSSEVAHYHDRSEQFFYVLSGIASLQIDSQTKNINAHEGIHVPAGVTHQLRNDQDCDLEFIVTSVPPSHGDRVLG